MAAGRVREFAADFDRLLTAIETVRAPVIAAVNGPAIGGGLELALRCDIRLASERASFVAAGVNVGLIANFWRLTRVVGLGAAKEILLTGSTWDAEQALRWARVTEVHSHDALLDAALEKAQRIASRALLSVEATKACVNVAPEMDRASANMLQLESLRRMFETEDHTEALMAFFERREGNFSRR